MLRRNARLRKEYLYRKSLEGKERAAYERKRKIKKALEGTLARCAHAGRRRRRPSRAHAPRLPLPLPTRSPPLPPKQTTEGRPIPTELRRDEAQLRNEAELEDDNTAVVRTHADDEYRSAGECDPKVLLTTSRDPSSRLAQFAKEIRLLIPNSQRVNRGGMVLAELVEAARSHAFTDLVILHEHRGEPDGLVVCHLPYGPTAFFGVSGAVLRHDIGAKRAVGTVSEQYPRLIFDRLSSPLGQRIATILKHLFPVPKDDAKRVVTFANRADYVSVRHHTWQAPKGAGEKQVDLTEVGPRFELRPYQIRLGTVDQSHAENEWVLRSYTRSAKKGKLVAADEDEEGGGGE
jgi:U3 small nucleolar ribonucleoprotein protein IMP4